MRWNLRRSKTRRAIMICLGTLSLAVAIYHLVGANGYRALERRRQEQREWEARNEALRRNNAELEKRIQELSNDPRAIEKVVREDLGYARPGEKVIRTPGRR